MYKTLFRMGYPFSYSLQDVGRYYLAYHALMGHWRRHIGDCFLDVDYEKLVSQPRTAVTPRVRVHWSGIRAGESRISWRWAAAATASAAQVRQPVYTSRCNVGNVMHSNSRQLAGKLKTVAFPLIGPAQRGGLCYWWSWLPAWTACARLTNAGTAEVAGTQPAFLAAVRSRMPDRAH